MQIIRECKKGKEISYNIENYRNNKLIFTENIFYKAIQHSKDGIDYLIIYDNEMNLISTAYEFLNFGISSQALNSRIKARNALKLLFAYQEIIHMELKDFKSSNLRGLKDFMGGILHSGSELKCDLMTIRSHSTINGYLAIYRNYLDFLDIKNKALTDKLDIGTYYLNENIDLPSKVSRYKSNEKLANLQVEVPRYISVEEFYTIVKYVRNKKMILAEIIIRLMFQCGLRIGEVLGLTADDLVLEKINEEYIPIAYIRNRASDKNYQKAKTCMKIKNKKQYKLIDYNIKGHGYEVVILPLDLFNIINEYIDSEHTKARNYKSKNYREHTLADRVRTPELYEDDNYYVFINTQGRPISQSLWNGYLRSIFKECGLKVDKDIREHNLNHRFRHGFAMFNVKYLGCKVVELADRLRHRSLSSVFKYFQPTISDQILVKSKFVNSLYELIPELKGSDVC